MSSDDVAALSAARTDAERVAFESIAAACLALREAVAAAERAAREAINPPRKGEQ